MRCVHCGANNHESKMCPTYVLTAEPGDKVPFRGIYSDPDDSYKSPLAISKEQAARLAQKDLEAQRKASTYEADNKPRVVTLCGSSRYPEAFHLANMHFSMMGYVVIGLGLYGHADQPQGAKYLTSDGDEATEEKRNLDLLHFQKIDLADFIFVINVAGRIGSSTQREIDYAKSQGKTVKYMFEFFE